MPPMVGFLCHCRRAAVLLLVRSNNGIRDLHQFLENPSSSIPFRFSSSTASTVASLINPGWLTPECAISSSKQVHFGPQAGTNSVIGLLKSHGFSEDQITDMLRRFTGLLSSNPEKTLLPKLECLYSRGIPRSDAARILSRCPWILGRSLENHIVPTFEYLHHLLGSGDRVIQAIRYCPFVLSINLRTYFMPNIQVLRDKGVPESSVAYLVRYQPRTLLTQSTSFRQAVDRVQGLGFNPADLKFCEALRVMRQISESTWKRKVRAFQRWGWSEETTIQAFRRNPLCLAVSEDKIAGIMEYCVNWLGADSLLIAKHPYLLSWSLERRIAPRCSVAKVLKSRCLMVKKYSIISFFTMSEKTFRKRFVTPYLEEAPELLDLYPEKEAGLL